MYNNLFNDCQEHGFAVYSSNSPQYDINPPTVLYSVKCATSNNSGRSRPSDNGGSGHPDQEIKGGEVLKNFFGPLGLSLV